MHSEKRIPSLDGLRALSIGLVLIGHAHFALGFLQTSHLWSYIGNGDLGVSIFFVISGFLITSLLLREHQKSGRISLSDFYIHRFYRIVPPFYVYITAVVLLWKVHFVAVDWSSVYRAATFTTDYTSSVWYLAHSWSLSVEEQFYLLWPATLKILGKARALRVSIVIICLGPALRVASYLLLPGERERLAYMFHNRLDGLMFGCALAMLNDSAIMHRLCQRWLKPHLGTLAALFLFAVSPTLRIRFQGGYLFPLGYSLESASIAYLLLYVVRNHHGLVGRLLNARAVAHVGVLSYSLYLWQQLFLGELFRPPLSVILAFAAAEASYRTVERCALQLRRRTETFRNARRAILQQDAVA